MFSERAGHAVEIVQALVLDDYVGIAMLSGDGLVSEVLHGLLTRPDRDRALRVPLLHLPCGTSNALAAAVAYASRRVCARARVADQTIKIVVIDDRRSLAESRFRRATCFAANLRSWRPPLRAFIDRSACCTSRQRTMDLLLASCEF